MKKLFALLLIFLYNFTLLAIPQSGTATTTRYWDCSGGSCGCGWGTQGHEVHCHSNALYTPKNQAGNVHGALFYGAAALSAGLGGLHSDGSNWLNPGCGRCFKVTGPGNKVIILKGTNTCPDGNPHCEDGKLHFDIAAPGFDWPAASISNTCDVREEPAMHKPQPCQYWGQTGECHCEKIQNPTLRQGCLNFFSLQWNNPTVSFELLDQCPQELIDSPPCWAQNGNQWPSTNIPRCDSPGAEDSSSDNQNGYFYGDSCGAGSCSDCGNDKCKFSWPINDSLQWNSPQAGCRCEGGSSSEPQKKYSCDSVTGSCNEDADGEHSSQQDCSDNCQKIEYSTWKCNPYTGSCTAAANGPWDTLGECSACCHKYQEMKGNSNSWSHGTACGSAGDGCCKNQCSGQNCLWSWPSWDHTKWSSSHASCVCKNADGV